MLNVNRGSCDPPDKPKFLSGEKCKIFRKANESDNKPKVEEVTSVIADPAGCWSSGTGGYILQNCRFRKGFRRPTPSVLDPQVYGASRMSPLSRQVSTNTMHSIASINDLRSWSLSDEDRRRHFLDHMRPTQQAPVEIESEEEPDGFLNVVEATSDDAINTRTGPGNVPQFPVAEEVRAGPQSASKSASKSASVPQTRNAEEVTGVQGRGRSVDEIYRPPSGSSSGSTGNATEEVGSTGSAPQTGNDVTGPESTTQTQAGNAVEVKQTESTPNDLEAGRASEFHSADVTNSDSDREPGRPGSLESLKRNNSMTDASVMSVGSPPRTLSDPSNHTPVRTLTATSANGELDIESRARASLQAEEANRTRIAQSFDADQGVPPPSVSDFVIDETTMNDLHSQHSISATKTISIPSSLTHLKNASSIKIKKLTKEVQTPPLAISSLIDALDDEERANLFEAMNRLAPEPLSENEKDIEIQKLIKRVRELEGQGQKSGHGGPCSDSSNSVGTCRIETILDFDQSMKPKSAETHMNYVVTPLTCDADKGEQEPDSDYLETLGNLANELETDEGKLANLTEPEATVVRRAVRELASKGGVIPTKARNIGDTEPENASQAYSFSLDSSCDFAEGNNGDLSLVGEEGRFIPSVTKACVALNDGSSPSQLSENRSSSKPKSTNFDEMLIRRASQLQDVDAQIMLEATKAQLEQLMLALADEKKITAQYMQQVEDLRAKLDGLPMSSSKSAGFIAPIEQMRGWNQGQEESGSLQEAYNNLQQLYAVEKGHVEAMCPTIMSLRSELQEAKRIAETLECQLIGRMKNEERLSLQIKELATKLGEQQKSKDNLVVENQELKKQIIHLQSQIRSIHNAAVGGVGPPGRAGVQNGSVGDPCGRSSTETGDQNTSMGDPCARQLTPQGWQNASVGDSYRRIPTQTQNAVLNPCVRPPSAPRVQFQIADYVNSPRARFGPASVPQNAFNGPCVRPSTAPPFVQLDTTEYLNPPRSALFSMSRRTCSPERRVNTSGPGSLVIRGPAAASIRDALSPMNRRIVSRTSQQPLPMSNGPNRLDLRGGNQGSAHNSLRQDPRVYQYLSSSGECQDPSAVQNTSFGLDNSINHQAQPYQNPNSASDLPPGFQFQIPMFNRTS